MRIFVINLAMSSPYRLLSSERLDEQSRKLNFKFKEDTRKKIHSTNQLYKSKAYLNTLDFHGLKICKEEQLTEVKTLAAEAHKAMSGIDPELYATLAYFSLDMTEISKGDTYGQVLSAIRYQIVSEVLDRLNEMTEKRQVNQLGQRSKEALIKMVDRLKAINILDDKDIERKLENIKTSILEDSVAVMKKDLIDEIIAIKRGGAYLKFREQGDKNKTPAPTQDNQEAAQ